MTQPPATTRRQFISYFSAAGLATTLLPGVLWAKLQEQGAARVTSAMLKDALAIAGLEFTDEQREQMLNGVNQNLARFEKLKRVLLIAEEFSPGDGTLTPSMKVKRRVVEERYRREIVSVLDDHVARGGAHP